jgi:hypothetical protein
VTRKEPPKPAYNPLQFVQLKPSNLYQSAQEQLKKAEEIKKVKEVVRKDDAEDWQNVCKFDFLFGHVPSLFLFTKECYFHALMIFFCGSPFSRRICVYFLFF